MGLNSEQVKIFYIFSNLIQSTWDMNNQTNLKIGCFEWELDW
jgi:hypothetical protein